MWQVMVYSFITFTYSSTFATTMPDAISDPTTKSTSTAKNVTGDNMSQFVSFITPILATINIATYLISPTQTMKTSELIQHYGGFETEEHTVISEGYKLGLFRIPGDGHPVFLMHGLFTSSDDWMGLGNKSLPLKLAQHGYDVWIGNARGNVYSRENTNLSTIDPQFWDFSFDEMGRYDLPACIDHIYDTVGEEKKLLYVGHSQGTTMAYIMLSERPKYNEKLLGVVSLAPISFIKNAKSPVFQLLIKFRKIIEAAFKALDFYEVFPHRPPISTVSAVSGSSKLLSTLFLTVLFTLFGFDYDRIDYNHTQEQLSHYPAGSALKQILHYLQIGSDDKFGQYNYGKTENLKKYGSTTPPSYKFENICQNMTFFYSANDWLSDVRDVKKLLAELPTGTVKNKVKFKTLNHMDYQWGKDIDKLVYNPVIKILDKYISC